MCVCEREREGETEASRERAGGEAVPDVSERNSNEREGGGGQ